MDGALLIPAFGAVVGEDAVNVNEPAEDVIAASLYAVAVITFPWVDTAIAAAADVRATSVVAELTTPPTDLISLR